MSGFWSSELGEVTGKAEDAFAKSFTQIPDGTMALAKIESFINAEYEGSKYLSIDWLLTAGDFKGAKVNQKLKVYGDPMAKDSAKARHRALNMLKLIYDLYKVQPKDGNPPTDHDLAVFAGKTAGIRIRETEPNDQGRQYNWVSEIHKADGFKCETGIKLVIEHSNGMPHSGLSDNAFTRNKQHMENQGVTDDIPF